MSRKTPSIGNTYTKESTMAALPEGQEFFTVDEIAAQLRISRRTVLNLLARKTLEGIRVGSHWRISREQFQSFLDRQGEPPSPELGDTDGLDS